MELFIQTHHDGLPSVNEIPAIDEDAESVSERSQEPYSKRRALYNALKGKISSSRSQTLDSITEAASIPAAPGENCAGTNGIPALEIELFPTFPTMTKQPPDATPDNEPKKIDFAIMPQVRNEIEIRSLPEIAEMLEAVKDHDVMNDVECNFDRNNIFATGGYGDIYLGAYKTQLENGETVEVKVAVKRFRTHIKDQAEKPFVKVRHTTHDRNMYTDLFHFFSLSVEKQKYGQN